MKQKNTTIWKTTVIAELSVLEATDYIVVGVCACLRRTAEGKAEPIVVLEPIPATALEAMALGLKTAFLQILALPLEQVLANEQVRIPELLAQPGLEIGEDFVFRTQAAARTYKAKPHLQVLPMGSLCTREASQPFSLQYSEDLRRLLGAKTVVKDSDNIKQHAHTHQVL